MRGVGCIDKQSRQTGNGFMPGFRDNQRIGEAKPMLQLRLGEVQLSAIQKGETFGRMLSNELEQGDILSGVRFGLALLAYTDILLCSIETIRSIPRTARF